MANQFIDLTNPLNDSGVISGTYNAATITVDEKGRVTSASNGTVGDQDLSTSAFWFSDFIAANSAAIPGFTTTTSGAGSGANPVSTHTSVTEKAMGVFQITPGGNSNGRATLHTSLTSFATQIYTIDLRIRGVPDSLGAVGDEYEITFGFIDNTGNTDHHTNGIYFRFNGDGINTEWTTVTSNADVRTINTTGVGVSITQMKEFRISVNEAGSSVSFYIDNVLVSTHATNIPINSGKMGLGFKVRNQNTTPGFSLYLDWYSLKTTWSGGR